MPSQFVGPRYFVPMQKSSEWRRSVGVKQNPHATVAVCSRDRFAKARTSWICSRLTDGNHSRNSSTVEPWSRCSKSEATGRRVPRKHHLPPSFPGLRSTALQRLQSMVIVYRRSNVAGRLAVTTHRSPPFQHLPSQNRPFSLTPRATLNQRHHARTPQNPPKKTRKRKPRTRATHQYMSKRTQSQK